MRTLKRMSSKLDGIDQPGFTMGTAHALDQYAAGGCVLQVGTSVVLASKGVKTTSTVTALRRLLGTDLLVKRSQAERDAGYVLSGWLQAWDTPFNRVLTEAEVQVLLLAVNHLFNSTQQVLRADAQWDATRLDTNRRLLAAWRDDMWHWIAQHREPVEQAEQD